MANEPAEIKAEYLLLVEGSDEMGVFSALIKAIDLKADFQIVNYSGKDKLSSTLAAYALAPDFSSKVVSLGIVRDADSDAKAAWDSVVTSLQKAKLPVPTKPEEPTKDSPRVNVFITPGGGRKGKLETLILEAIEKQPEMNCVVDFVKCLKERGDRPDWEKETLQAYIAAVPKSGVRLPGEAARAGYLNLTGDAYGEVVAFIKSLT